MKIKIGELKQIGMNQYMDSAGRYVIADRKNRIAYVVEKEDNRRYQIYSSRFVLAFIAGFFAGYFLEWYVGVFVGVLALIFLQLSYKSTFLPSLPAVTNIDFPAKISVREKMIRDDSPGRTMSVMISSALLPVVSLLFLVQTVPGLKIDLASASLENRILVFLLPALSVFAIYMFFVSFSAMREIRNRRKDQ